MERKLAIAMVLAELQANTGSWKELGYGCYLGFEDETYVIADMKGKKLVISEEVAKDLVNQWINEL